MDEAQHRQPCPADGYGHASHEAEGGEAGDAGQREQHGPGLAAVAVELDGGVTGDKVGEKAGHG